MAETLYKKRRILPKSVRKYYTRALIEVGRTKTNSKHKHSANLVHGAFIWSDTSYGNLFWGDTHDALILLDEGELSTEEFDATFEKIKTDYGVH